ncbi:M48 family metallopeptidase [Thiobacter aerophilum]|uniref:M48 family metallopeptidase n=1 Tax=Thiobacter aerophilum TaxID=3121275 RepID=A0ABV0EET0_9BURK
MIIPAQIVTAVFLSALTIAVLLQLWLARRHIAHILAHRDRVPAAFAERITLADHQKAADYTVARTRLNMVQAGVDALLVLALTLGGGLDALDGFWRSVMETEHMRGPIVIINVMLLLGLAELPFSAYRTFVIDARFGFNRMTPALFVADLVKGALVMLVLGLPLLLVLLWLMHTMGEHWWLYAWGVWVAFNLLVLFLYPTVIAPLFNRFTPLPEGALKRRIEALLQRCGFTQRGLYVMDGSRRTSHGNAYFTGLGKAKRIVFYDTLLEKLSPEEVEAVLAHELGHFKHRHVVKRLAWVFAASLAALWLLAHLIEAEGFFAGLGVSHPSAYLGLTLFMLVAPVFGFLLHPLIALYSRRHEFEADAFAAHHASATALVRALTKLYQDNAATLTPDSLYSTFYDSHPPAALRIGRLETAATH